MLYLYLKLVFEIYLIVPAVERKPLQLSKCINLWFWPCLGSILGSNKIWAQFWALSQYIWAQFCPKNLVALAFWYRELELEPQSPRLEKNSLLPTKITIRSGLTEYTSKHKIVFFRILDKRGSTRRNPELLLYFKQYLNPHILPVQYSREPLFILLMSLSDGGGRAKCLPYALVTVCKSWEEKWMAAKRITFASEITRIVATGEYIVA